MRGHVNVSSFPVTSVSKRSSSADIDPTPTKHLRIEGRTASLLNVNETSRISNTIQKTSNYIPEQFTSVNFFCKVHPPENRFTQYDDKANSDYKDRRNCLLKKSFSF